VSPDAHKTARTAIYVVGGLMGLSLVGGLIMVGLVASEGTKAMNAPVPSPNGPINAGTGAFSRPGGQINSQLTPRRA